MGVLQTSSGRVIEEEKKQVHFTAGNLMEQYEIAAPPKLDRGNISGFAQKVEE